MQRCLISLVVVIFLASSSFAQFTALPRQYHQPISPNQRYVSYPKANAPLNYSPDYLQVPPPSPTRLGHLRTHLEPPDSLTSESQGPMGSTNRDPSETEEKQDSDEKNKTQNGEKEKVEEPEEKEKEEPAEKENELEVEPSALTLRNFFIAGWDEEFKGRSRVGRAPRMHFFTTRQPFLDREARLNYFYAAGVEEGEADEHELSWELEIPFNRRFMLDFEPGYSWIDGKGEVVDRSGAILFGIMYFQLIDTDDSAVNFQFGVAVPSGGLGLRINEDELDFADGKQTTLDFTVAGWEDLTRFGLYRASISYHLEYLTRVGPDTLGASDNTFRYGLAVAQTYIEPDATYFRDFSLFLENFANIELDGEETAGRADVSFLPGFRWNLGPEKSPWWVMFGVEIPVTGPRQFDYTARLSLIHWFE